MKECVLIPNVASLEKNINTYVINKEIDALHRKGRLTSLPTIDSSKKISRMFWLLDKKAPRSKSEKELPTLLRTTIAQDHLTFLDLSRLKKEEISAILETQGKPFSEVTEINLEASDITNKELIDLLKMCPNLEKLYIHNCNELKNINLEGIYLEFLKEIHASDNARLTENDLSTLRRTSSRITVFIFD